jgi:hypothetical protein
MSLPWGRRDAQYRPSRQSPQCEHRWHSACDDIRMTDDLVRRSGKGPDDAHPQMAGGADDPDPSDYGDPRVAQAGDDPDADGALGERIVDADRLRGRSGAGDG